MSKMEERPEPIGPEADSNSSLTKLLLLLVAALALSFVIYRNLREAETVPPHQAVGAKLTQLKFQPLTGTEEGRDSASLAGKVTLINFWGTWCPPCIAELPEINALYEANKDNNNFEFVSVSCSSPQQTLSVDEIKSETQKFVDHFKYQFPTYRDADHKSRLHILRQAQLPSFAFPTNIIIQSDGTIAGMWVGYDEKVVAEIKQVLKAELAK